MNPYNQDGCPQGFNIQSATVVSYPDVLSGGVSAVSRTIERSSFFACEQTKKKVTEMSNFNFMMERGCTQV
jgi:hypothetical protein